MHFPHFLQKFALLVNPSSPSAKHRAMDSPEEGEFEDHPTPTKAQGDRALKRPDSMAPMREGQGLAMWSHGEHICMCTQTADACNACDIGMVCKNAYVKRVNGLDVFRVQRYRIPPAQQPRLCAATRGFAQCLMMAAASAQSTCQRHHVQALPVLELAR